MSGNASIHVGMIPIIVSDQQRALEFYRDKLGFEVVMDENYGMYGSAEYRWIAVGPQRDGPLFILYSPGMNPGQEEELRRRVGAWTGIVLYADDIHETYEVLSERGVPFDSEPMQQPYGGWETWFADPDGNRFSLGTDVH